MYTKAIVRLPCKNIVNGLTAANLGKPDYEKAFQQHSQYRKALRKCGLEIVILESDENFPDSTFVEDTALLTPSCAIITNPGAPSRKSEIVEISEVLKKYFRNIEHIQAPGTVDAGDILNINSHYYIGISGRTNLHGAEQLASILKKYGMSASNIFFKHVLHLKSGASYLGNNNLVAAGEFKKKSDFHHLNLIEIDDNESYAANCVCVNEKVLIAKGFPKTKIAIESAGYETIEIDVSEFMKVDGGLSCLSLRF